MGISLVIEDPKQWCDDFVKQYREMERIYVEAHQVLPEKLLYVKTNPVRQPLCWYLGHTASFAMNKMRISGLISHYVDKELESLFAVGVDEMNWDSLLPDHDERLSIEKIYAFRTAVFDVVEEVVRRTITSPMCIEYHSREYVFPMIVAHTAIHFETSVANMIYLDPRTDLTPMDMFEPRLRCTRIEDNGFAHVSAGTVCIENSAAVDLRFMWDNETGRFTDDVPAFEIARCLISNAEYLPFVEEGCYSKKEYWTDEGWEMIKATKLSKPVTWLERNGDGYMIKLVDRVVEWAPDLPTVVTNHEATAFAKYMACKTGKKYALPTEGQYYRVLDLCDDLSKANHGLRHGCSMCAVDVFKHRIGDDYMFDLVGNLWYHASTTIFPFQGSQVQPYYIDFSLPTYGDDHTMLLGSSFLSTKNEAHPYSRYAFRPHFPQYAAIRLVINGEEPNTQYSSPRFTDKEVVHMLELEYAHNNNVSHASIAQQLARYVSGNVLHIGARTGRVCFEMAQLESVKSVIAIEQWAHYLAAADQIRQRGQCFYVMDLDLDGAELMREANFVQTEHCARKVEFVQCDAINPAPYFEARESFDTALFTFVDRCPTMEEHLRILYRHVKGRVIIFGDYRPVQGRRFDAIVDGEYVSREAGFQKLIEDAGFTVVDLQALPYLEQLSQHAVAISSGTIFVCEH
ncbi:hypothetical protein PCE1_000786 [Barthelona sp. PCE]